MSSARTLSRRAALGPRAALVGVGWRVEGVSGARWRVVTPPWEEEVISGTEGRDGDGERGIGAGRRARRGT